MNENISKTYSVELSEERKLNIVTTTADIDDTTTLCAINWYDVRSSFVYQWYFRLATPLARKLGVSVLFKGIHFQKLEGDEKLGRDRVLVAEYPKGISTFRLLLQKKFFLLISLLRIKATANYHFGFMKQMAGSGTGDVLESDQPFLVYTFKTTSLVEFDKLQKMLDSLGYSIVFGGVKAAQLSREIGQKQVEVPFLMDGLLILKGIDGFEALEASTEFSEWKADHSSGYMALFRRL